MSSSDSSMYHNETVIETATFQKDVIVRYQLWSSVIIFGSTIVGIPLLLIIVPLILLIWPRVINTWKCVLTNRAVHVEKGLFVKVKKTIPLEKITDVGSPTTKVRGMSRAGSGSWAGLGTLSKRSRGWEAGNDLGRLAGRP